MTVLDTEVKVLGEMEAVHLRFKGRISMQFTEVFEARLEEAISGGHRKVIIDLDGVEIIASNGLRVLLVFAKKARKNNVRFAICGLSKETMKIFEISGFTEIFEIHPCHKVAIQAFTK